MKKTKARITSNNSLYILSFILLVSTVLLGLFFYDLTKESLKTTVVIVTAKDVKLGSIIKEDDLTTIEVGRNGLPSNIATNVSQVVGRYAVRDMKANEYVFSTSLTDDFAKRLSERAKYGAIAVPIDNLQAVTGDIRENDFVGAYISVNIKEEDSKRVELEGEDFLPDAKTALIYSKDLAAIRVLGLYDGSSNSAGVSSRVVTPEGQVQYRSPSMIVFDAMPKQRTLLIQAIDNGKVRLIIHPEYIQKEYRKAWKLEGENLLEEDNRADLENIKDRTAEQKDIKDSHDKLTQSEMVGTYLEDKKKEIKATDSDKKIEKEENKEEVEE